MTEIKPTHRAIVSDCDSGVGLGLKIDIRKIGVTHEHPFDETDADAVLHKGSVSSDSSVVVTSCGCFGAAASRFGNGC